MTRLGDAALALGIALVIYGFVVDPLVTEYLRRRDTRRDNERMAVMEARRAAAYLGSRPIRTNHSSAAGQPAAALRKDHRS